MCKKMKKYVFALLMLISAGGFAQVKTVSNVDSIQLDESKDLQEQLIPLDSIIVIAVNNSPSLKFQQDVTDAARYQVDFTKKEWTNNIVGFANYATGNQSLVAADNQASGSVISTSLTNGYRAGVQVNLPLYSLIGRKARINMFKADLQSTKDKEEAVKQDLVRYIIQVYYNLIYSRNLITIRSDAKQSGINQYHVAEQEFKDGTIAASELSRLKTIEVNARADYEDAKRQFATNYFQFLNLVGVPIEKLIEKR